MKARKRSKEVVDLSWRIATVEQQREEFVSRAAQAANFAALCREYGISRQTGYTWLGRAQEGEAMEDRSHAPHTIPGKTKPELEQAVLTVRAAHPAWGGKKIRKVLENQGVEDLPCVRTVGDILKRNGCISKEASVKSKPFQRFERDKCNELWQTDFKGDFGLKGGGRCYPLTILDDHSRFLLKVAVQGNMQGVTTVFREVFLEFGLPLAVLSDNGGCFHGLRNGFVTFERWLMEHDVQPIHGRIWHPQTQGKVERIHETMDVELLNDNEFFDLSAAEVAFGLWREDYNYVRPHEALGLHCPGEVYHKSERFYCEQVPVFEYSGEHNVVRVDACGYVKFAGFRVYLSETFANQFLEFRENLNPLGGSSSWLACFRNFRIVEFDAQSGQLLNRSIRRLYPGKV
jgi:transposase InsO family protein